MPPEPSFPARERVGRYRVTGKLGEGGMGLVLAAEEEVSGRPVAVKLIRDQAQEPEARRRLLREGRIMESVVHPNVCRVFEIGEHEGELFLAMERLEGQSLAERLSSGPLPFAEAIQVELGLLAAVDAIHAKGLVHRDLKPANVFLTVAGVKLLDFGLARLAGPAADGATQTQLTQHGAVPGTPRYLPPEQLQGQRADARGDVFAAAAVLFEMLTGRPAFGGKTAVEIFHATLYENPPALSGSPAIAAADRVIRRGLAKRPEHRYPAAAEMARELRATLLIEDAGEPPRLRAMTRLMVLPFRMARADAETDFLAFSLPDAITGSLNGLDSLVVRSSLTASRFADQADLKRIAAEAEVDIVLTGTLLRAGDRLRVATQLVEVPSGDLVWSQQATIGMQDVFRLEGEIVQRIVGSLSLSLTAREHRLLHRDVPATPASYEFYLRANQHAQASGGWPVARDLYQRCLDEDPRYAPAWAQLGRLHRLLAKYGPMPDDERWERAEQALRRALELNPDLSVAHNQLAQLEADLGRAPEAMRRLLTRAVEVRADPELFAGLVHVCRYCGLFEASLAAHDEARRLDAHVRTSVVQTLFFMGDYEGSLRESAADIGYIDALALIAMGREAEALTLLREREGRTTQPVIAAFLRALRAMLEGHKEQAIRAAEAWTALGVRDPESGYYMARKVAYLGEKARALALLQRCVGQGFAAYPALARDPWLDPLRAEAGFKELVSTVETRWRAASEAFREAGGERLLGTARP